MTLQRLPPEPGDSHGDPTINPKILQNPPKKSTNPPQSHPNLDPRPRRQPKAVWRVEIPIKNTKFRSAQRSHRATDPPPDATSTAATFPSSQCSLAVDPPPPLLSAPTESSSRLSHPPLQKHSGLRTLETAEQISWSSDLKDVDVVLQTTKACVQQQNSISIGVDSGVLASKLQPSYKDVLLQHSSCDCRGAAGRPLVRAALRTEEEWQEVKPRHARCSQKHLSSLPQRQDANRRAAYFIKMQGMCFNCLARDHKVAQCRDPVRCWRCHQSGHISSSCPKRQHCPSLSSNSTSRRQATGSEVSQYQQASRRAVFLRKMRGLCFNCLAQDHKVAHCQSLVRCWVCYKLGHISSRCPSRVHNRGRPTMLDANGAKAQPSDYTVPPATMGSPEVVSKETNKGLAVSQDLLLSADVSSGDQHDPMMLKSGLVTEQMPSLIELCSVGPTDQSEVKMMEASVQCYDQIVQEPSEDNQTPLMIRSEAEQSFGHQLIKALSNFKENAVAPISSSSLHTSFEKETVVASKDDNQHCIKKPKYKIKAKKPGIKVVRDMLTKKWIFFKRHKQLGDLPLQPFSASHFEATKKLLEVAIFIEVIKKLTEAAEKKKKKRVTE